MTLEIIYPNYFIIFLFSIFFVPSPFPHPAEEMYFQYNELTGQVPSEIGNLDTLFDFQFWYTYITGVMPSEVCDIPTEFRFVGNCPDYSFPFECACCAGVCYPDDAVPGSWAPL